MLIPPRLVELYGGEQQDYVYYIKTAYQNSTDLFQQTDYEDYTSNIEIQRYFFRFMDRLLPVSNPVKNHIFHFLNAFLTALSITIIIIYIIQELIELSDAPQAVIWGTIIVFFFAPDLIMYGKNLYWCAWTLFMPIDIMILLHESKTVVKSKYYLFYICLCCFFSVIIKCLFYFEFISTVLVSMIIPLITHLLNNEDLNYKKKSLFFLLASLCAIAGFLTVNLLKYFLLLKYYGNSSDALAVILGNINDRVLGNINADNSDIVVSANVSLIYVITTMLNKPFISVRSCFTITQLGLILLSLIATALLFAMNRKRPFLSNIQSHWIFCCWVSLLAPLSWFILAKPHTYIHNHHCSVTWFIIFDFMAVTLIAMFISRIYHTWDRGTE